MSFVLSGASFKLAPCSWEQVALLQRELRCSETMAWVLARRNIGVEQARALFEETADYNDPRLFHDPFLMGEMTAAVERIRFAIDTGETIVIHGDYDADGVCSTTMLAEALDALGAQVRVFLPNRITNGYGLQIDSVERFALDGTRLLICVDCGITAVEPVAQAIDRGMDVIVCDHHQPGEVLPNAILCSSRPGTYPFPDVCATVVAGKLVQALGAPYGPAQHELEAIATIADCMPLINENRHIVRRGLAALRQTQRPGIRSLLTTCDTKPSQITEQDIGFRIAPRINAAGRLGNSDRAYELLRADASTAGPLARELHETNERRRQIERDIVDAAEAQIESWTDEQRAAPAYVLSGEDWHEGVVGIVASRIVERYQRPAVVIAELQPLARGSGRSVDGFDLHAALAECSELLVRWGGHTGAVGLTIEPSQIPEFRRQLADVATTQLAGRVLAPVEHVDAVVSGDELSMALIEELEQLAPFGTGNERPKLLAVGATVSDMRPVGDGRHLKCRLSFGGTTAPAIGFGIGEHAPEIAAAPWVDACVRATVNRFRGAESLQLEIDRLIPAPPITPPVPGLCATHCTIACTDRVALEDLLSRSSASSYQAGSGGDLPGLEALLAKPDTVDVRHAGRLVPHVSRLATAGLSVAIVCADVSRRRALMTDVLHPTRFGVSSVALAGSRCNSLGIGVRLQALKRSPGPVMVLTDYAALEQVLNGPHPIDAVVVLDPPSSIPERDVLAAATVPLHLIFGAAEIRFATDAAAAISDIRSTLGQAWKTLRGEEPVSGDVLEHALLGNGEHIHTPEAVAHALHSLNTKGLVTIHENAVQWHDQVRSDTPS